ncbi:MAG: plasmid pRiA4b ORF-3 family protein [Thermoplasmata archaeon]|nr:plasmid pRiA4b ORF-3 family protein [Thermoplasmata archaeon]
MKKRFDHVYQFKISLKGAKPPIWRRIQVPETYSFWDLHVAIQDAMGWDDYHLHEFEIVNPSTGAKMRIGLPEGDYDEEVLPGWKQKISHYFSMEKPLAGYIYDFGDWWEHRIRLEKIVPRDKDIDYPICIKGKRACPPEDCGGISRYYEFLETIKDPENKEHEDMLEWVGGGFDPERFDPEEVGFDDPAARRRIAFG